MEFLSRLAFVQKIVSKLIFISPRLTDETLKLRQIATNSILSYHRIWTAQ